MIGDKRNHVKFEGGDLLNFLKNVDFLIEVQLIYSVIKSYLIRITRKVELNAPVYASMCAQSCQLFATPWTVTCQAPLSMESPRQEYWRVQDGGDTYIPMPNSY